MRRALELAGQAAASVLPNPVVGCVLLSPTGDTVGEGWHQRYGEAHAEVNALGIAGPAARGATAVVTLEPCNHTGRTGPCTQALIAAGVARVVIANRDPWAPAAGGVEVLRAAGVEVETGVLADDAADVNRVWLTGVRRQRPFVTFKAGMTLDGRVAAPDGTSRWITSAESRADVHLLRRRVDTMLVGSGTVLADDPLLTVRDADGSPLGRQPLRVVADSRRAHAARRPGPQRRRRDLDRHRGGGRRRRPARPARGCWTVLWTRGRRHVLLEGGPRLAAAFFDAGLVDEVRRLPRPRRARRRARRRSTAVRRGP